MGRVAVGEVLGGCAAFGFGGRFDSAGLAEIGVRQHSPDLDFTYNTGLQLPIFDTHFHHL
jgi:hypothetical protein